MFFQCFIPNKIKLNVAYLRCSNQLMKLESQQKQIDFRQKDFDKIYFCFRKTEIDFRQRTQQIV